MIVEGRASGPRGTRHKAFRIHRAAAAQPVACHVRGGEAAHDRAELQLAQPDAHLVDAPLPHIGQAHVCEPAGSAGIAALTLSFLTPE